MDFHAHLPVYWIISLCFTVWFIETSQFDNSFVTSKNFVTLQKEDVSIFDDNDIHYVVYTNNANESFLKFNSNLFQKDDNTDFDYQYKYWSNGICLLQKVSTKQTLLERSHSWNSQEETISIKDWIEGGYKSTTSDTFLAFKDIKVHYNKPVNPNLFVDQITKYESNIITSGVEVDVVTSVDTDIFEVEDMFVAFGAKGLRSYSYTYVGDIVHKGHFVAEDSGYEFIISRPQNLLQAFVYDLKDDNSELIQNPVLANLQQVTKTVSYYRFNKTTANTTRYIKLPYRQTDSIDCFNIKSKTVVNVYLAFESMQSGIHLDQFSGDKTFCLDKYLGLQFNQNYMITLTVTSIGEHYVFFEKNVKSQPLDSFSVLTPNHYTGTGSDWMFYNELYNFTMVTKVVGENWVCDITANCFPMKQTGVNIYTISKSLRKFLTKTPFVRIKSNSDSVYFNQTSSQSDNIAQHLKEVLHESCSLIKNPIRIISNKVIFPMLISKADGIQQINIPLRDVDLRIHQLEIKIKSSVEKPINLRSVVLSSNNFYSEIILNRWFVELETNTSQWFHVRPYQLMKSFERNSLSFKISTDDYVDFTMEVSVLDAVLNKTADGIDFEKNNSTVIVWPISDKPGSLNKPNTLLMSDWIQGGQELKIKRQVKLNFNVLDDSVDNKFIIIKRLIMTDGNIHSQMIQNWVPDKQTLMFKLDDNLEDNHVNYKTDFKLAYLIETNLDNVSFGIEKFVVDTESMSIKHKQFGPIYPQMNNNRDYFSCPTNFKIKNFKKQLCELEFVYKYFETKCEPNNGCGNLFEDNLMTIGKDVSLIDGGVTYFAYKPDNNTDGYLLVNKSETETGVDFCVSFKYVADQMPLLVNVDYMRNQTWFQSSTVMFPITDNDRTESVGQVCASELDYNVTNVKQMALWFNATKIQQTIVQLDRHYISTLQYFTGSKVYDLLDGIHQEEISEEQFYYSSELNDQWTMDANNIMFQINADETSINKLKGRFVRRSLSTKWIDAKNNDGACIGYKLSDQLIHNQVYRLFLTLSGLTTKSDFDLMETPPLTEKPIYILMPIPAGSKRFKVTINIDLDIEKVIEFQHNNPDWSEWQIILESFSINDPHSEC